MFSFFLYQRVHNLSARSTEPHPVIKHHELHRDTSDGGEFLDDAIYLEDLPVTPAEVSVAAGSPDNLL
ncbi:MAG TPA: hypothetical protein VF008_07670 [Niastella sp.]